MTIKEALKKAWKWLKWVFSGVCAIFIALFSLRKKQANKQIEKNEETITKIETEKEIIEETIENIDNSIFKIKEEIKESEEAISASEKIESKAEEQLKKNQNIIDKYKDMV